MTERDEERRNRRQKGIKPEVLLKVYCADVRRDRETGVGGRKKEWNLKASKRERERDNYP